MKKGRDLMICRCLTIFDLQNSCKTTKMLSQAPKMKDLVGPLKYR